MNVTKEQLRELQARVKTGSAVPAANVESGPGNGVETEKEAPRFDRPVSISIHSRRKKLTDSDGICCKYVIDALVSCGVLSNDDPSVIPESPKETQEKCGKDEKPETIIIIKEVV